MTTPPKVDFAGLEALAHPLRIEGLNILQSHRLHADDRQHVRILMHYMDLPRYGTVVDMGCGFGEVAWQLARLAPQERGGLEWVLVNRVMNQLRLCPTGPQFYRVRADAHCVPLEDGMADYVMFTCAIVNMDAPAALTEARRLVRRGAQVFLYEMFRHPMVEPGPMEQALGCRVHTVADMVRFGQEAGLRLKYASIPGYTDDSVFRALLARDGLTHLLDGVFPMTMRFTRDE